MQMDSQSAKWYRHITELPLNRFIDVLVDDNYAALVITGYPPIEELQLTWMQVQGEYADAIDNHEHKMYISLFKEVTILALNLQTINALVGALEQLYVPEFGIELNKILNASFKLDPSDPDKYRATLKSCIMRSKSIKINLDLKQMQLAAMQEKMNEPGKKPTREYFISILTALSNHVKYHISDSITVYEFCDRLKTFNKYCEQVKKQDNVRRTNR